ncbi:hypothetical protein BSL78_14985 [Apostichopus japonicus]|uniref:Uncharacterized protein n=1 Tax=Stichopus japonicus TaxID=307972 RepID=A0A2G8KJL3_STIJA|nr:hypothetical protein BSL78_14985 [Apostichopus japonicus]
MQVYQSRPAILQKAVTIAVEMEAFTNAEQKKGAIEAGSGKVAIGEQTSGNVEQVEVSCCLIRIAENVMIAPGCETVVPGSLEKKSNGIAVVELLPRFLEKHGMIVARAVVDASMSIVPVRVLNRTDQHKTIYEGTKCCHQCEPVKEISCRMINTSTEEMFLRSDGSPT